jgi:hypothetical protein
MVRMRTLFSIAVLALFWMLSGCGDSTSSLSPSASGGSTSTSALTSGSAQLQVTYAPVGGARSRDSAAEAQPASAVGLPASSAWMT